jgi:hypothetical protein
MTAASGRAFRDGERPERRDGGLAGDDDEEGVADDEEPSRGGPTLGEACSHASVTPSEYHAVVNARGTARAAVTSGWPPRDRSANTVFPAPIRPRRRAAAATLDP